MDVNDKQGLGLKKEQQLSENFYKVVSKILTFVDDVDNKKKNENNFKKER